MDLLLKVILFITIVDSLTFSVRAIQYKDVSNLEVTRGREQYELMRKQTALPRYGECWKSALNELDSGCKVLTENVQHRLAYRFMTCFLLRTGRHMKKCSDTEITTCVADLDMATLQIYNDYFIHTNNMCSFLQVQVWNEITSSTIDRLATSSNEVVHQLSESSQITAEMLKQQQSNHEIIMKNGLQLNEAIASSSENAHLMFEEFKQTTQNQKMMIGEVFDKVAHLQSTILGEFAGFYSIVFHTLSILISYLLTSTPRTSAARFWLFALMVTNIGVERLIVSFYTWYPGSGDIETFLYHDFWLARKVFWLAALAVIVRCAVTYQDYNIINNNLLLEIQRQNAEIRKFVKVNVDGSRMIGYGYGNDDDTADITWYPDPDTTVMNDMTYDEFSDDEHVTASLENTCLTDETRNSTIDGPVLEELREEAKALLLDVTYRLDEKTSNGRYHLRQKNTESPHWNPVLRRETPEDFAREIDTLLHRSFTRKRRSRVHE